MIYVIFLFCILFFYVIRVKDILLGFRNNDALFHLNCAHHIRQNGGVFQTHFQFYPGYEVPYTYPPFLHLFLSLLSEKVKDKYLQLLPLIFEVLLSMMIILAGLTLGLSFSEALLAGLVYLLIPLQFRQTRFLSPRPLGVFFFFLLWFSMMEVLFGNQFFFYPLAVVSLSFLLLSHRMGVQLFVLLYFCFLPHLIGRSSWQVLLYFLWPLLSLGVSYVFTKGHLRKILRDHWLRLRSHFQYGAQGDFQKKMVNPLKLLFWNPLFVGVIVMLFVNHKEMRVLWMQPYFFLSICIFVISIFWRWGGGERYVLFASPFLCLEFLFLGAADATAVLLSMAMIFLLVNLYFLKKDYGAFIISPELKKALDVINDFPGSLGIVLPKVSCPAFVYFTDKQIFAHPHDAGAMSFNRLYLREKIQDSFALERIIRQNRIEFLLVESPFIVKDMCDRLGYHAIYQNDQWEVYYPSEAS